jgi:hypothetical protein
MSVPEDTFTLPTAQGDPTGDTASQTQQTDQVQGDGDAQSQQDDPSADAAGGEQQQERDDKGRFKGGVQSRIDELTRLRHEAEREAAYWRGRAGNGGAGEAGKQEAAQPSAPEAATKPKPTPDQFDDYGEYIEALTEWKAEEKVSKALTEREAKAAQAQQAAVRATTWEQRQAATRSALPDYDAVVGASDAPVAQHVAETLQESEHGPALAYHLAKHPEVLERLNGMSPRQADREIGRLEERLAATANAASGETDTPAVKTTQAPKPASVTSSQGRSVAQDPSRMSPEEYVQWRSKGPNKARWAR